MTFLANLLCDDAISEELGHDQLIKNREALVADFSNLFPEVSVAIWLFSERTLRETPFYYLSRLRCNGRFIEDVEPCLVQKQNSKAEAQVLYEASRDSLVRVSSSEAASEYVAEPLRLPTICQKGRNAGYIVFFMSDTPSHDVRQAMTTLAHDYSTLLLDSRMQRKILATQHLNEILLSQEPIERKLSKFLDLMSAVCGMKNAEYINFQGASSGLELPSFQKLEDLDLGIKRKHLENGGVLCNPRIELEPQRGALTRQRDERNYIAVPILESARSIDSQIIMDAGKYLNSRLDTSTVNHVIVLSEKKSCKYISGTISDTDIELCESLSTQFQIGFNSALYDKKVQNMNDRLLVTSPEGAVTSEELYNLIAFDYFECAGVSIYDGSDNLVERPDSYPADISNAEYEERMLATIRAPEFQHRMANVEIGLGCDVDEKGARFELFLANEFDNSRLLVFHLDKMKISATDLRIFKFLATELAMIFKNFDSVLGRLGEIAQIRHAIISPLTSTSNAVENLLDEYDNHKVDQRLWSVFRSEEVWAELQETVKQSIYAKALAENGKYLFLQKAEQALDKKSFNLADLFKSVVSVGHRLADGMDIVLFQKPSGSEFRSNGERKVPHADVALLYLVMVNLIDNAIKYTLLSHSRQYFRREFPQYSVEETSAVVKIELFFDEDEYEFKVTNVGRFIPDEEMNAIRSPFVRGRQYRTINQVSGTGIGIPASERIIVGHSNFGVLFIRSKELVDKPGIALNECGFRLPYITNVKVKNEN